VFDLRWSWLCVPYLVCAAALTAIGVVAALIRGDRVMRLGVIGTATTALPWAVAAAVSCWTDDPAVATRVLRLGLGPVALVGPNLLIVLLGVSGQLERQRWVAFAAGITGALLLGLCWGTEWTVPGVHRLQSGMFYITAGPLTDLHVGQLALWLVVGLAIARRSMMRGERRRMLRIVIAAVVLAAIGITDVLIIHEVIGAYPIAWLPATIACGLTLHLELRTDLLRPRGFDRTTGFELVGVMIAAAALTLLVWLLRDAATVAVAASGSALWVLVLATARWLARRRTPRRFGPRAVDQLVARLAEIDGDRQIAAGIVALGQQLSVAVRTTWRAEPGRLIDVVTGASVPFDPEIAAWLAARPRPLATADLATMRVGPLRPRIEAFVAARGATLFVPLVDRGALIGLVEADHTLALREGERALTAEAARAAVRALTYTQLARVAAREGATAREVEVAEAMRLRASASRDAALGPWVVAAEYRSAPRTTGATWSVNLLDDDRLALLVTEGQAHGVVAALATAALTGAFVAATTTTLPAPTGDARPSLEAELDGLLSIISASAEGVRRGGEPIAAFVAILDATTALAWACAGHPGAEIVGLGGDLLAVRSLGGDGARLGDGPAARGVTALGLEQALVVASTGVRGDDRARWLRTLGGAVATGPRLAQVVVELAARRGAAGEDLLAVVVRQRRGDGRSATLSDQGVP
jgi:hypothetical protein